MNVSLLTRVVNRRREAAFLAKGEYGRLEKRVLAKVPEDIGVVVYYAFDWRTRVGPFVGSDLNMPNCGARNVGSSFQRTGFNTRVVLGTWNPNFDFRHARLNGKVPQIFGVSSMQIHEKDAHEKIRQAISMGDERPLIIGGGPHANYQAWDYFDRDPTNSVDVAVMGETNVLYELLERIVEHRGNSQTMLESFENAKRNGALDDVKGIMYLSDDREILINTGKPLLVADLDEFQPEIEGFRLIEPRSWRRKGLKNNPIPLGRIRNNGGTIVSMITSRGCNFDCDYCPIPENAQYTERSKSPERMVEDFKELTALLRPSFIFGTCDNALAFGRRHLEKQYEAMARATVNGKRFRDAIRYGTEATQHQADLNRDLFPIMRDGGVRALWFGIEDLTRELVTKGQSPEKTIRVFEAMNDSGIAPMAMMMHFQGQPLKSEDGSLVGILNQVNFLRQHGAASVQITYNSPSIGSRAYNGDHYDQGTVLRKAGDMSVDLYLFDGNHVVSTPEENKLERQDNIVASYERFFNYKNLFEALTNVFKTSRDLNRNRRDVALYNLSFQIAARKSLRISKRNIEKWRGALATGRFEYADRAPESSIPIARGEDIKRVCNAGEAPKIRISYKVHAKGLYDRFVHGAEDFIRRHRGDVSIAKERLTEMAGRVVLHEGKRLADLGDRAHRTYHDFGERADGALDDLRKKINAYIEAKLPLPD
ncbi:radical SAM protein [Candidatus Pacearchaeota archaeon]|nr:radical SAM protein [Candidatus Pacearchaeota archaeon]